MFLTGVALWTLAGRLDAQIVQPVAPLDDVKIIEHLDAPVRSRIRG